MILGFAIGYERKLRFKEVGIRTHTIVCAGSALIMVVLKYGFGDSIEADMSRVAAQIVSGIGFLGAGIIVYRKHEISIFRRCLSGVKRTSKPFLLNREGDIRKQKNSCNRCLKTGSFRNFR